MKIREITLGVGILMIVFWHINVKGFLLKRTHKWDTLVISSGTYYTKKRIWDELLCNKRQANLRLDSLLFFSSAFNIKEFKAKGSGRNENIELITFAYYDTSILQSFMSKSMINNTLKHEAGWQSTGVLRMKATEYWVYLSFYSNKKLLEFYKKYHEELEIKLLKK